MTNDAIFQHRVLLDDSKVADYAVIQDDSENGKKYIKMKSLNRIFHQPHFSLMVTLFMMKQLLILVFSFTMQLTPKTLDLIEVFSDKVVFSPTAMFSV